jgi:ABC-type proline/glycine betaine transport system permease subunit
MFGADAIFPALVILLACGALSVAALLGILFGLLCLFHRRRTLGLILVVPSVGYLWLLICLFGPGFVPHPQAPGSAGIIDLRRGDNLKMIFDGGLRPYRLQGLESSCCVVDRATVTVIVPRTSPFTIKVDRASIDVLDGNQIASIDLFGLNTSVPEAVTLTKTICGAWNVPTTGLGDAVAHLGTRPETGKGWGTEFNQPKIRAQVTFQPLYYNPLFYFNNVGGYVNVTFILGDHFNGMKFLTHPIQPPPGYENISMNPPPRVVAFPSLHTRIRIFMLGICALFLGLISLSFVQILRSKKLSAAPEE